MEEDMFNQVFRVFLTQALSKDQRQLVRSELDRLDSLNSDWDLKQCIEKYCGRYVTIPPQARYTRALETRLSEVQQQVEYYIKFYGLDNQRQIDNLVCGSLMVAKSHLQNKGTPVTFETLLGQLHYLHDLLNYGFPGYANNIVLMKALVFNNSSFNGDEQPEVQEPEVQEEKLPKQAEAKNWWEEDEEVDVTEDETEDEVVDDGE